MKLQNESANDAQEKAIVEYVPFGGSVDKIKLTVKIVQNLIAEPSKTGKLPSEKECIKFMAMCQARKLNPFEGDAFLLGYDSRDGGTKFSLITAHQAFLKRAEVNYEYDGMESGVVVMRAGNVDEIQGDMTNDGDQLLGGWARVHFKNRKFPMYKRIKLSRFKKSFGVWETDPAGMICKCAEADALRSSFPTMLSGLYLREEKDATATVVEISAPHIPEKFSGRAAETAVVNSDPAHEPVADRPARPSIPTGDATTDPAPTRKKLKKKEPVKIASNYDRLVAKLSEATYTPDQFLQVALKNKWVKEGTTNLGQVPDADLADFVNDNDNWELIILELAALTA